MDDSIVISGSHFDCYGFRSLKPFHNTFSIFTAQRYGTCLIKQKLWVHVPQDFSSVSLRCILKRVPRRGWGAAQLIFLKEMSCWAFQGEHSCNG